MFSINVSIIVRRLDVSDIQNIPNPRVGLVDRKIPRGFVASGNQTRLENS